MGRKMAATSQQARLYSLLCARIIVVWITLACAGVNSREYCTLLENFQARCESNEVILMTSAVYGRMRLGRCIEQDVGYLGCSSEVLPQIDHACSGRRDCEIIMMSAFLKDYMSCPKTLAQYLEAEYQCIKVQEEQGGGCRIDVSESTGYLANLATRGSRCGRQGNPWVVESQPGQKIELTQLNFATDVKRHANGSPGSNCVVYAEVSETGQQHQICQTSVREQQVYMSTGNRLEIYIATPAEVNGAHFLLKYEVIGCSTPKYPDDMWIKRQGDQVTLGCYTSRATWRLECQDKQWRGEIGQCTAEVAEKTVNDEGLEEEAALTSGQTVSTLSDAVIITIAVCSAVLLSVILLVIGMIFGKRSDPPPMHFQGVPLGEGTRGGGLVKAYNYDTNMSIRKPPIPYSYDTYQPNSRHMENTDQSGLQASEGFQNRSLPRIPGGVVERPLEENIDLNDQNTEGIHSDLLLMVDDA